MEGRLEEIGKEGRLSPLQEGGRRGGHLKSELEVHIDPLYKNQLEISGALIIFNNNRLI